jgi:hypothetical protein
MQLNFSSVISANNFWTGNFYSLSFLVHFLVEQKYYTIG